MTCLKIKDLLHVDNLLLQVFLIRFDVSAVVDLMASDETHSFLSVLSLLLQQRLDLGQRLWFAWICDSQHFTELENYKSNKVHVKKTRQLTL